MRPRLLSLAVTADPGATRADVLNAPGRDDFNDLVRTTPALRDYGHKCGYDTKTPSRPNSACPSTIIDALHAREPIRTTRHPAGKFPAAG